MAQTTAQTNLPSLRSQVLILLAGALIWSVYHIVGYLLVEVACRTGVLAGRPLGIPAVIVTVIVLTILAILGTLYAAYLAYQSWQRAREEESGNQQAEIMEGRTRFLSLAGLLLNALFLLIILLDGIPAIVLSPCG